MNNIYGLTVVKNEASRYLADSLRNTLRHAEGVLVYDDQSSDQTVEIAHGIPGTRVIVRKPNDPSFLDDEGLFRWNAWRALVDQFDPDEGDWIVVIDADEFIIGRLRALVQQVNWNYTAIAFHIPEVFGFDYDGAPLIRTDRLWATIHGARMVRFKVGAQFRSGAGRLGVPNVPEHGLSRPQWYTQTDVFILHYGYARLEDQLIKYGRYSGRPGHADSHVQSIVLPDKTLVRWDGECPRLTSRSS